MSYRRYFVTRVGNDFEEWNFKVDLDEVLFGQAPTLVMKILEKFSAADESWQVKSLKEIDKNGVEIDNCITVGMHTFYIRDFIDAATPETIGEFEIMARPQHIVESKCIFKKRMPVSEEYELSNDGVSE